ncbi:cAMP-binding domain of CRP or a regulatory subunit of cAMP-dependent protein kinases [Chitinophaga rupis]|uniref:cAMP-binding domain of CRP or a regulatory subunit of cAMP-dependent protein kinases n=1 Tax=Chitinophaga rupis TaxID=573321 RepID=A0A1H7Q1U1_9BACT|nr:Crp/Fnr family transcriptional regulator [Chitinophaga rupis]SEL41674.1 cAMP-binding domain of CRP or a regulatory subunit of cAMP-dependent protein kinases [Chitinophaga rupis]
MTEFISIIQNVSRFITLTREEELLFTSLLRMQKVRKKQFIVQPEYVCQYRTYIATGALRSYFMGNDGQEYTIALAVDDWWISDFTSYIYQEPATLFVEAMENSTLIQISYQNEQMLYEKLPKFERFFRLHSQRGAAAIQKRMLGSISKTAEERYEEMQKKYPQFLQRFPQYVIASYLGMTTQFLSRIRNQKLK